MLLHELKDLLRNHGITGCSNMNKTEIIDKLASHGIINKMEIVLPQNDLIQRKVRNRDHTYLKNIRKNSKCVELKNMDNNEVHTFPSIYKAAKFLKVNPGLVHFRYKDHKSIDGYEINML